MTVATFPLSDYNYLHPQMWKFLHICTDHFICRILPQLFNSLCLFYKSTSFLTGCPGSIDFRWQDTNSASSSSSSSNFCKGKGKGKVHPRTGHEGPEGE
jgi:hypothetical protein